MLPVALCVIWMRLHANRILWHDLRLLREASMHEHQQGLYGSRSWGDENHNAKGWPQRMQGHSYPCRKLCRRIRATGRLVWRERGWMQSCRRKRRTSRCLKHLQRQKLLAHAQALTVRMWGGVCIGPKKCPLNRPVWQCCPSRAKKEQMEKMSFFLIKHSPWNDQLWIVRFSFNLNVTLFCDHCVVVRFVAENVVEKRKPLLFHSLTKLPWSSCIVYPIAHGDHHSPAWVVPVLPNHSMWTNYLSMRIFSPAWMTPFNCNATNRHKGFSPIECSSSVNIQPPLTK